MTTTIMRDSVVGDAWIMEMCRRNPVQRIYNAEGKDTGIILSGPVRLAFTDGLFVAKAGQKNAAPGAPIAYRCTMLFPPLQVNGMSLVNLQPYHDEYNRVAAKEFASHWNGQYFGGLDNPWHNQGDKPQLAGYTPGCYYMAVSSQFKPPIVDMRGQPITDPNRVYGGIWAIVANNAYPSGKTQARKGPRFGLSSVMIIADDNRLGGGGVDPGVAFRGASVTPPTTAPTQQFGMAAAAQMAATAQPGGMPGMPGVNSWGPPQQPPQQAWGAPPPPPPQPQSTDWQMTPEQRRLLGL